MRDDEKNIKDNSMRVNFNYFNHSGNLGFGKRCILALRNENGFLEMPMLISSIVIYLTIFAILVCINVGMLKVASAKYQWFAEAMTFAAEAANITGDIDEVMLNENLAERYFEFAMGSMVGEYDLVDFKAVDKGHKVPGGRAQSPGYLATIRVKVFAANVPLIGRQEVRIPMRYFAVVESEQL